MIVVLLGLVCWGVWFVLSKTFQGIVWLFAEGVPNLATNIGNSDLVGSIGDMGWVLIGALLVWMSVAFFRSQRGKRSREFVKLWYTTHKEKWCPPVRVV